MLFRDGNKIVIYQEFSRVTFPFQHKWLFCPGVRLHSSTSRSSGALALPPLAVILSWCCCFSLVAIENTDKNTPNRMCLINKTSIKISAYHRWIKRRRRRNGKGGQDDGARKKKPWDWWNVYWNWQRMWTVEVVFGYRKSERAIPGGTTMLESM